MTVVELVLSLVTLLAVAIDDPKPRSARLPMTCEVAMSPGMRISATTSSGTIVITAVDEVTRSYTWDGATRAIELEPHKARYYGSLGLFHDPMGEIGEAIAASRAVLPKRGSSILRPLMKR